MYIIHVNSLYLRFEVKDKPGVAASIFKPLSQNLINVDMVVQNISLNGKETDLTFTIKSEDLKEILIEEFNYHIIENGLSSYHKLTNRFTAYILLTFTF